MTTGSLRTVHVRQRRRGDWEVELSGQHEPICLETLDEAKRVAYLTAAHRHPCELIVQDAYHRVVEHEFIDGVPDEPGQPPPRATSP
jgi:hypothetical protein